MPRGRKMPQLPALHDCEQPRVAVRRCSDAEAQMLRAAEAAALWGACKVPQAPLWVGSHSDALQLDELRSRGIGGIINVATECENPATTAQADPRKLEPQEGGCGVTVLRLDLQDHSDAPILQQFLPAAEFAARLWERNMGVLVHCRNGISRAPTVTTAILMLQRGQTHTSACNTVQRTRAQASPNLGFVLALEAFAEGDAAAFRSFAAANATRNLSQSQLLRWYRLKTLAAVASNVPVTGVEPAGSGSVRKGAESKPCTPVVAPRSPLPCAVEAHQRGANRDFPRRARVYTAPAPAPRG
eukprot:TRINITY_DN65570_c0_g1_i1.p1 TRINITY_DN65570_c0_g1~~TRINITY_DN65570_c0_g1_i1.p1  ORF type:complete len:331 (+),score=99.60 TRINITY_DN65570_c0_g1_i1:95-994(+)